MAPKAAPTHPKYVDLVKEAIVSLKERGGSSIPAIKKYIAAKYPSLPAGWEKTLSVQLKRLVDGGKLVKVNPVQDALPRTG
jgi:histone H1/5